MKNVKEQKSKNSIQPSKKAWEKAYEMIETLILKSEIKPSETVTEVSLSERLNIGRTPVREALKKLEERGLIHTNNGRKSVYVLSIKQIDEIFDIKVCIEGGMAKWAAIRGQEKDFEVLEKIMEEMKAFGSQMPLSKNESETETVLNKWLDIDKRLHSTLFKMANNLKSEEIIRNLNTHWHKWKVGLLTMEGRIEKAVGEHERFVLAILNRNPVAAEEAMKEHMENLRRELIKLLKLFNYYS